MDHAKTGRRVACLPLQHLPTLLMQTASGDENSPRRHEPLLLLVQLVLKFVQRKVYLDRSRI